MAITLFDFNALAQEQHVSYQPDSKKVLEIIDTIWQQYCAEPAYKKFLVPFRDKPIADYEGLNASEIEQEVFSIGDLDQLKGMSEQSPSMTEKIKILEGILSTNKQVDKLFKRLTEAQDYRRFIGENEQRALSLYNKLYGLVKEYIFKAGLQEIVDKGHRQDLLSSNYVTGTSLDNQLALSAIFTDDIRSFFPDIGFEEALRRKVQAWRLVYELESFSLDKKPVLNKREKERIVWLYHMIPVLIPTMPRFWSDSLPTWLDTVLRYFQIKIPVVSCKDGKSGWANCPEEYQKAYEAAGTQLPRYHS